MRTRQFQALVVATWTIALFTGFTGVLFDSTDPAVTRLLEWDGYGAIVHHNFLYAAPILLISVASAGVAFFQNWGRYLYLATVAYLIGCSFLFGYRVSSPADSFFGGLSLATMSAVLALIFLSPMSKSFGKQDAA